MISKNKIRYILSLQKKKARDEERVYVIEGDKLVKEYLNSGNKVRFLAAKPEFISSLSSDQKAFIEEAETASFEDLRHISALKTPHNALAVVPIPDQEVNLQEVFKGLSVALDFIQDPGNLGTIVRAAAWFGIGYIFCSYNCVDVYNPKVVQASMGAILQVKVHYCELKEFLRDARVKKVPVYGAFLEGESIYSARPGNKGIIVLGNESKGISPELKPFIAKKLVIPKFTSETIGIESLNVSMAASIIFSEFARRRKVVKEDPVR